MFEPRETSSNGDKYVVPTINYLGPRNNKLALEIVDLVSVGVGSGPKLSTPGTLGLALYWTGSSMMINHRLDLETDRRVEE